MQMSENSTPLSRCLSHVFPLLIINIIFVLTRYRIKGNLERYLYLKTMHQTKYYILQHTKSHIPVFHFKTGHRCHK